MSSYSLLSPPTSPYHHIAGWGLYVHIPFCARKCPYCDFTVAVLRDPPEEPYIRALIQELDARAARYKTPPRTLYVGGGTPGLLQPHTVRLFGERLRERGMLDALEEFTVEFNPEQADDARLHAWKAIGATRISLGVQALHDDALKILGREHRPAQAYDTIRRVKTHGFSQLSVDFIFAVPGVLPHNTCQDLIGACACDEIDHVSLYELTVEPRTAFGVLRRQGRLPEPPEDHLLQQWHNLVSILAQNDFERYEVSSFARPQARAKHNAAYWVGRPYLGIGVSASSLMWDADTLISRPYPIVRQKNKLQLKGYLEQPLQGAHQERISWQDHVGELLIMAMRTRDGVDIKEIEHRFACAMPNTTTRLNDWEMQKYVIRDATRYAPTHKGMEIAESIAYDLLLALDQDVASLDV